MAAKKTAKTIPESASKKVVATPKPAAKKAAKKAAVKKADQARAAGDENLGAVDVHAVGSGCTEGVD